MEDEFNEWENNRFKDALDWMVMRYDGKDDSNGTDIVNNTDNNSTEMSAEPSFATQAISVLSTLAHQSMLVPTSSVMPVTTHTDSSLSATISIQQALAESTSKTSCKQAQPVPFESFINTTTATDSSSVQMTKKPCKVRSNKSRKQDGRSKENHRASPKWHGWLIINDLILIMPGRTSLFFTKNFIDYINCYVC